MNYDAHIKDYTNEGGGNHRWATRAIFGNSIMSLAHEFQHWDPFEIVWTSFTFQNLEFSLWVEEPHFELNPPSKHLTWSLWVLY
jgi:hypothetical protein